MGIHKIPHTSIHSKYKEELCMHCPEWGSVSIHCEYMEELCTQWPELGSVSTPLIHERSYVQSARYLESPR
jgi:hypothetical protein